MTDEERSSEANSLQCDDCGKQLRDATAAQIHAEKTQHQSFSESVNIIKPLTEEEKKQKLQQLRENLAKKRQLEAEKELLNVKKNAAIERKKTQESSEIIEELQRKSELQEIAKKKKEKAEDLAAKARVRAQLEQDKKDRADRSAREKAARQGQVSAPVVVAAKPDPSNRQTTTHLTARLQIRHAKGTPIIRTWDKEATMLIVAQDISQITGIEPPNAVFKMFGQVIKGEALKQSLEELRLLPSASLQLSEG